jgi:LmbE family N-acetylglucosaminyl deacetylase
MEFVDFRKRRWSKSLDLFFPGWQKGEKVAFLSPHDDDVLLGAAYLLLATKEAGGVPLIFIFCQGDAGYSAVEDKSTIVATRRKETVKAYDLLGVREEEIFYFDIPDFSLAPFVNRRRNGGEGLFEDQLRLFRREKVSRVVFSSGYYEHWDHTAVYYMGVYTSPQAGDPILADLGKPWAPKSYYAYSVWGDFEPEVAFGQEELRADKGILVSREQEEMVREAIQAFASQKKIFKTIVDYREKRKSEFGYLELYKSITIRKPIDFTVYFQDLARWKKG